MAADSRRSTQMGTEALASSPDTRATRRDGDDRCLLPKDRTGRLRAANPWGPLPRLSAFICGLILFSALPAMGRQSPTIDFDREVRPIFREHCIKCHGPNKQGHDLRLDRRRFAADGGKSGHPILGGTVETNEIIQRITSTDVDSKMPKEGEPLTAAEITTLKRWVADGTLWPDEDSPEAQLSPWLRRAETGQWYFDRYLRPIGLYLAGFFVVILICERCKVTVARDSRWASSRFERVIWQFHAVPRSWYLVGILAIFLAQAGVQSVRLQRQIAQLEARPPIVASQGVSVASIYGMPPIPFRPDQPRRLGGEYYRGNCERSEKLFNGGNYLTATFRLSLHGPDKKRLEIGDPLPPAGLLVRMEIERAPGTTDSLYTPKIMDNVFLSPEYYDNRLVDSVDEPVFIHCLEPEKRWEAFYPVPKSARHGDGDLSGLVYVYKGVRDGRQVGGDIHYGIKYELKIVHGRIAEGSDLWLGSVFWTPAMAYPPDPRKVPFEQWFGTKPLPVITGQNTTSDPKLLGILDYPEAKAAEAEKRKVGPRPGATPDPAAPATR